MFEDRVPDKALLRKVHQRMARTGTASARVQVEVKNGDVTVSGTIQYEHQRRHVLRAASGVSGVRRVNDNLKVAPKQRY